MSSDLAIRETLPTLVRVYQESIEQVTQAYATLEQASVNMKAAFISEGITDFRTTDHYGSAIELGTGICNTLKQQAWRCLVDRLEIRRILSVKRRVELDKQLYDNPKLLPDITEENVLALLQDSMAKATTYAEEAVKEIFEWLRPCHGYGTGKLKTNQANQWQLGKKVVVYAVEAGWGRSGKYRVSYGRQKEITALDNVFHMLDGKGPVKTHNGPLHDAIADAPEGIGETEYFKFKAHKNGNLHIEFKRMDIVNRINKIAGGDRIKGE